MKMYLFAPVLAVAMLARPAFADDAHHSKKADGQILAQTDSMSTAEVRKVDKDARKITLKHGPIKNLDMPGMTMVFHVSDPAMLDQVKTGDKVKFSADKVGDKMTVTKIEPEK